MRVLHLFSNWKLTGPAEPAVRLAAEQMRRGHEVLFAHMATPADVGEGATCTAEAAARYGVPATTRFRLPKHTRLKALWLDVRELRAFLAAEPRDVVHVHMLNDHLTAALALRKWRSAAPRPALVRTNHEAAPLSGGLRTRWLLPRRTDALIELSEAARAADIAALGLDPARVFLQDASIELARFDPSRLVDGKPLDGAGMRARYGLDEGDVAVGVAARIQMRRRYDLLLEAVAAARSRAPRLRLIVIGRGTHMEEVAVKPAHALGIADITRFPGYLRGDDYVAGLLALDVKAFLMPGTDGSCRAAREAMALGRPILATPRGMLPELVGHEREGLVVEETVAAWADALVRLAGDSDLRARLGSGARAKALARFDPATQAAKTDDVYAQALAAARA